MSAPSPTVSSPKTCRLGWILSVLDFSGPGLCICGFYRRVFHEQCTSRSSAIRQSLVHRSPSHVCPLVDGRMSRGNSLSAASRNTVPAHPTLDNLISFKRFLAKAQWVTKVAKETARRASTSSLYWPTRSDVVWEKLRCMSGKHSRTSIRGFSVDGTLLTSQADIANTIASSFVRRAFRITAILTSELLRTAQRPSISILLLVSLKFITLP